MDLFEKITLTDEQKKMVDEKFKLHEALLTTIKDLSLERDKLRDQVWQDIHEWYPNLSGDNLRYCEIDGTIIVTRKSQKSDH